MTGVKQLFFLLAFVFLQLIASAQISPPGLGKANTASWFALGLKQDFDTIPDKGWQSVTYVGFGSKSNPDNRNPFFKPGILIVNQEFYHQFHKAWQYSLAFSYRRQHEYEDSPPYEHQDPELKQEFRFYGRISYMIKASRIKITPTFRQEFRKFYAPGFADSDENFQLRTRFRLQLAVNLDKNKMHKLVANSEQLFSISKENIPDTWTDFMYRESRFSFFYSISPKALPLIFNIGYMLNLVGRTDPYTVHFLAFDIGIDNPFSLKPRSKRNP